MATGEGTRRERIRALTIEEIKQHAIGQVAAGGAQALSLNAIAKSMGMSGPAIYRYFGSREELLAALVTDGYREVGDLAQTVSAANRDEPPARRLAAVGTAYREWALANPYLYELLYSVRPEGYADPTEAVEGIEPAMSVLIEIIGAIAAESRADNDLLPRPSPALDGELRGWAGQDESRKAGESSRIHLLCIFAWTRLHGIISLELAGIFSDMGLDGGELLEAEVAAIVVAAGGGRET